MTNQAKQGFAPINGVELYYEISGHGEPLILIHSLALHSGMWDEQVAAFKDRYQVIRYDLSGFGQSKQVTASDADDLNALLDYLGIQQAHLLGLSIGAELALNFTLTFPSRVKSLTLVSSALEGFEYSSQSEHNWQRFYEFVQARDFASAREEFLYWVVDGPVSPAAPPVRERVRHMLETYTFVNFFPPENVGDMPGPASTTSEPAEPPQPQIERLGEIKVPTLVIVGDRDDPDIVKVGSVLADKIADARLITVQGAAHLINLEQPAVFNQSVLAFLAGIH
ncbi:MAG: alpha/beta hydrolase [Anaerolineae bacterium]|nr:alpha/beta hydrolase [Anaerolineae bacterium]